MIVQPAAKEYKHRHLFEASDQRILKQIEGKLYYTTGDGTWSMEDWRQKRRITTSSLHHKVSEIMYRVHMKCLPSPSFLQMIPWDNPQLAYILYILYSEYFRFRLFYMACLYKVKGKDHLWNPHFRSIITQLRRTSKNHFNMTIFIKCANGKCSSQQGKMFLFV